MGEFSEKSLETSTICYSPVILPQNTSIPNERSYLIIKLSKECHLRRKINRKVLANAATSKCVNALSALSTRFSKKRKSLTLEILLTFFLWPHPNKPHNTSEINNPPWRNNQQLDFRGCEETNTIDLSFQ